MRLRVRFIVPACEPKPRTNPSPLQHSAARLAPPWPHPVRRRTGAGSWRTACLSGQTQSLEWWPRDGSKLIWVRTFDGKGNFSEIVMVSCMLETTMPMQPQVSLIAGALPSILIQGLEPMAGWE